MIQDFSLNIGNTLSQFYRFIDNIHMEGTVSQNFDIGPSFIFIQKKREDFDYFFMIIFLHFIKQKLGPIYKF